MCDVRSNIHFKAEVNRIPQMMESSVDSLKDNISNNNNNNNKDDDDDDDW